MRKISLYDSSFYPQKSLGLGGDNIERGPTFFEWGREGTGSKLGPAFFTDKELRRIESYSGRGYTFALLVEPPSLHNGHYIYASQVRPLFDRILTFDQHWVDYSDDPNIIYYPLGGSWIDFDRWGVHPKTKPISIIVSEKTGAPGHLLRREVVKRLKEEGVDVDVYGRGVNPVESKFEALAPYRASIVIESIFMEGYFSEKLIDCLSVGTIPIYWGCPNIRDYFDNTGTIYPWRTVDDLVEIAKRPPTAGQTVLQMMVDQAKQYRCPEDWIWQNILAPMYLD